MKKNATPLHKLQTIAIVCLCMFGAANSVWGTAIAQGGDVRQEPSLWMLDDGAQFSDILDADLQTEELKPNKSTLYIPMVDTTPPPDNSCFSGVAGVASTVPAKRYIIGGEPAPDGSWPCMAALVFSFESNVYYGQFCGGTLIAPEWVLTAAHCLADYSEPLVDVVLGEHVLGNGKGERVASREFIIHPNYNAETNDSDVAIVWLAQSSSQAPVLLIDQADELLGAAGSVAVAVGWGRAEQGYPYELRQVSIPIVSNSRCNNSWFGLITANMICAGNYVPTYKGTCYGDSGGPLFVRNGWNSGWVQAGVVSWGSINCEGNFGVYTRVNRFRDWIHEVVCSRDANAPLCLGDSHEPDDGPSMAKVAGPGSYQHDFHVAGDSDWVKVSVEPGEHYEASTRHLLHHSATELAVFAGDGTTPVVAELAETNRTGARLVWMAAETGEHFVRVRHPVPRQHGISTSYTLSVRRIGTPGDPFEPDNEASSANPIASDGTVQIHTFHEPGDQDWLQFEAKADMRYLVATAGLENDVDTVLTLYSGEVPVAEDDDSGIGAGSRILWTAPGDGLYLLKIHHYRGDAFGPTTAYQVLVRAVGVP